MPPTYPNVTVQSMELTPCQVFFRGPSDVSDVDLGGTLGNVVISSKFMKAEIKADQLGETVLNRKVSGFQMTVTTELVELLNKNLLKVLFPHGVLAGANPKYFQFVTNVGDDDLSNAGILKLHPLSQGSSSQLDWTFPKACASAESEFSFSPTEQYKAKIVWNILPDMSVTPAKFATIGDDDL